MESSTWTSTERRLLQIEIFEDWRKDLETKT